MYVCLFDIDGTLINTGGAGRIAMERALADEFGIDGPTDGLQVTGRTDRAIVRDLFQMFQIEDSPENWQRFLAAYVQRLPGHLTQCEGRVLPGIVQLLEQLGARDDVEIGLLTGNVQDGARLKLSHYQLFHHFSWGAFGDRHLHRDHVAQEALTTVRKHLARDISAGQIWVIGDTPLDIRCARAIGAKALAVATGVHTADQLAAAEPDVLLDDLAGECSVLDLLE